MTEDNQHEPLINDIRKFVEQIQALNTQAVVAYTPIVDEIIKSQSKDSRKIEWTLDHLLDFAGDERMLNLFKKLCRYYLPLNPQAVAEYIQFYKEYYDEDEEQVTD